MAQLKYDITPANATKFAADIAAAVEKNEGVKLDFSVASLAEIDKIIGRFHEEGCKAEELEATLFCFGCYVGEVFVRHAKAVWRKTTQKEIDDWVGVPLVLQIGGYSVNPIGKVIKRLQNGDVDYLPFFYTAITSEISRQRRKRPRPP
jgi:membrane-anchored protein YejM (alkaline phosphatase superfamily)